MLTTSRLIPHEIRQVPTAENLSNRINRRWELPHDLGHFGDLLISEDRCDERWTSEPGQLGRGFQFFLRRKPSRFRRRCFPGDRGETGIGGRDLVGPTGLI